MVSKSANKPTRSQPARFLSRTANLGPWLALGFYDRGFYDTEDYCIYMLIYYFRAVGYYDVRTPGGPRGASGRPP